MLEACIFLSRAGLGSATQPTQPTMNWAKATNFLGHAENMLAKMDGSVGGLLGGDSESEEEGTASSHSCRPSHPPALQRTTT